MIENKVTNGLGELFDELETKRLVKDTNFQGFYKRGNKRITEAYEKSKEKQTLSRYNLSLISIN